MPHDGPPFPIPESKSLTILLNGSDKIFYYYGSEFAKDDNKEIHQTTYVNQPGLGKIIREKQIELENRRAEKMQLVVLIKPGNEFSYRDFVAVLVEMLINKVPRYAVVDLEKEEASYLERHK
jgi:hypothetical protein